MALQPQLTAYRRRKKEMIRTASCSIGIRHEVKLQAAWIVLSFFFCKVNYLSPIAPHSMTSSTSLKLKSKPF